MPASTSTRFTLAHANASARLPKSVISAHTNTLTTDSAIVPMRTNDACAGVIPRNFVMSPMETTPTIGQKSSSKKKNTLRDAISALRTTTAHTARRSARQLNEHLLQLGLAHAHVAHGHALGEQLPQQVG